MESEESEKSLGNTNESIKDSLLNQALGWVLGAFIGDSAGSALEYVSEKITQELVDYALTFPGGGNLNHTPGELTDDSELALSLMNAILECKGKPTVKVLAKHYIDWGNTDPQDIGDTTKKAINEMHSILSSKLFDGTIDEDTFYSNVYKVNGDSKSNGCLMRATPLSVLCHSLDPTTICDFTKVDVKMTHPNQSWIDAVWLYNIAISYLLNNPKDNMGAIQYVDKFIKHNEIDEDVRKYFYLATSEVDNIDQLPDPTKRIGWVMISFSYAFYYLKLGISYEEAINRTLLLGGDTDTNATIVGGMMGAMQGFEEIPKDWVDKVVNAESDRGEKITLHGLDNLKQNINTLLTLLS